MPHCIMHAVVNFPEECFCEVCSLKLLPQRSVMSQDCLEMSLGISERKLNFSTFLSAMAATRAVQ